MLNLGRVTNLARSRLRKVGNNEDFLGCRKETDHLADLKNELFIQGSFIVGVVRELAGSEMNKREIREDST